MTPVIRDVLALPNFAAGVGLLFWCFQLAALTGFIKFWKLWGPRSDVQGVLCYLKAAFRYKVLKLGPEELHQAKCVYLTNHRSWSDFFVDMYITGARALPLSRMAVAMAFPAFSSSLVAIRSILLFNRAGVRDTDKFNAWLDAELAQGPQNSLLVYPEGTRSLKQQSLPLKRGMLRYAFTRRLPVQVVVTSNKEEVMNERRRRVHFGSTLVTANSEVLDTTRFDDFEKFMAAVQAMWDGQWERVHSASSQGLPELPPPVFPTIRYSAARLAVQSAALAFWTAVLLVMVVYSFKAVAGVATSGPGGMALVAAGGLYTAASMAAAAWLPPPPPAKKRSGAVVGVGGGAAMTSDGSVAIGGAVGGGSSRGAKKQE